MRSTGIPSVYELPDGRYQALVTATVDGKRKRKKRTCKTLQEAINAAARLRKEMGTLTRGRPRLQKDEEKKEARQAELIQLSERGTVRTYAESWLKGLSIRKSTRDRYETTLRIAVYPQLGGIRCKDLTRMNVKDWVKWSEEAKVPRSKPVKLYSHETVQGWWRVTRDLLQNMAADLGLRDPTWKVKCPQTSARDPKREQRTLTTSEVASLIAKARRVVPKRHTEIAVLAKLGLRTGELFALRWDCVFLDAGFLEVRRAVWNGHEGPPKTNHSRTIPLDEELKGLLKELKEIAGVREGEAPLVFPGTRGATYRSRSSLDKPLKKVYLAAGIDVHVTPQVLRRTVNTLLVEAHVPGPIIRAMMGHASKRVTNRYSGIHMAKKREAMGRLSA